MGQLRTREIEVTTTGNLGTPKNVDATLKVCGHGYIPILDTDHYWLTLTGLNPDCIWCVDSMTGEETRAYADYITGVETGWRDEPLPAEWVPVLGNPKEPMFMRVSTARWYMLATGCMGFALGFLTLFPEN